MEGRHSSTRPVCGEELLTCVHFEICNKDMRDDMKIHSSGEQGACTTVTNAVLTTVVLLYKLGEQHLKIESGIGFT